MKDMEVVFLQEVAGMGREGEVKQVAPGYARNFLIPRGLALPATPQAIKSWQERKRAEEKRQRALRTKMEDLAQDLEGFTLNFKAKTGGKERLYGSVTSADIAAQLQALGVEVDRRQIALDKPLRKLGSFPVTVRLAPGLAPVLMVVVEAGDGGA